MSKIARQFARGVIRRKWDELVPLFPAGTTAEALAAEFGWATLGPKLRRQHIELTGEAEDMVPDLDPPKRFEVYDNGDGTMLVEFLPAEDSEFDACYSCLLTVGDRVTRYEIRSPTE